MGAFLLPIPALLRNSNLEVTTLEWYYFNQFGKF